MSSDSRYDRLPMIISEIRTQIAMVDDIPQKLAGLNNLIYGLEQLQKIQSVEVEPPISIVEEIGKVREEIEHWNKVREASEQVATKELINGLKGKSGENGGAKIALNSVDDKKNWMLSAKLWSTFKIEEVGKGNEAMTSSKNVPEFSPVKKPRDLEDDALSLSLPIAGGGGSCSFFGYPHDPPPQQRESKKQRRRWTSDLHARFVNAIEILGGARAATPGRIKDIMQVDDLTYEEIKSHLQKYRLQIRELSSSSGDGVLTMQGPNDPQGSEIEDHSGPSEEPSRLAGESEWATEW